MNSLGTPDTSFSGLNTLTVLSVDKSGPDAFPVLSSVGINIGRYLVTWSNGYNITFIIPYPDTTTIKSMMFQGFLKYESGWRTNPMATILVHISTVKIPRK